jgi:peroxiredoxin
VHLSRAQILFALLALCASSISIFAQPAAGQSYRINFVDVDGNALSTSDGRITTIVLTNQSNVDKAHAVGDHTPDFCLGNSRYRMITVLAFEKTYSKPVRMIMTSLIRRRVDSEARRLQTRYDQLKIARNARHDVSAVADFDGTITKQLGAQPVGALFHVFVFGRNGELLKQWNDVPSAEELAAALTAFR